MANLDSDDDLRRAIQLSLQCDLPEVGPRLQRTQEIVNLDSEDESTTDESADEQATVYREQPKAALPPSSMGILGLDRKAMEQERLARKRKASISPPPVRKVARLSGSLPKTLSRDHHRSENRPPARQSVTPATVGEPLANFANTASHTSATKPSAWQNRLSFPNGAVKRTWVFGHPREGDDIKLEEVLQKNDLTLAVLSSFQWDVEWLLRKINTKTTQMVFAMQADTDAVKAQYRQETASMPNLRLCFPSMEGQVNCMHSKLMLLSYPTHLRIVVPTANLVPYDWGESGIMENTVFLIDLPRLGDDQVAPKMTHFAKDLIYFLQAKGLDQSIIDSIRGFDTSATRDLAFVHTVGGAHMDNESWRNTGYCGLGRAISRHGLASDDGRLAIDYVTSSVGSLTMEFLSMLHLATQGDDGMKEYEWRNTTLSKRDKAYETRLKQKTDAQERIRKQVEEGFRIYFPSEETVKASKGGPANGGTICFQRKWWESSTFPRDLMRDCRSRRRGTLMHNKIIYVYPHPTTSPSPKPSESKAWAYIGSANCSESAWGKLVKDRKEKCPKLNCRNWECGVVVPLRRAAAMMAPDGGDGKEPDSYDVGTESSEAGGEGLDAFRAVVPVPMEYPGEEYGGSRPWFNGE